MSCSRYRDAVVLYADGELTGDASSDVKVHLAGCPSCRETLGELERLEEALTLQTSDDQQPTMAETRFWRSFEADLAMRVHRESTPFWRRAIVLPVPAAVCMGLAVIALGAVVMNQRAEMAFMRGENRQLQARIEAEQDQVVFALSDRGQAPVVFKRNVDPQTLAELRQAAPMSTAKPVYVPAKDAFRLPAPSEFEAATVAHPAPRRIPAGMEVRFVDTASADFY